MKGSGLEIYAPLPHAGYVIQSKLQAQTDVKKSSTENGAPLRLYQKRLLDLYEVQMAWKNSVDGVDEPMSANEKSA